MKLTLRSCYLEELSTEHYEALPTEHLSSAGHRKIMGSLTAEPYEGLHTERDVRLRTKNRTVMQNCRGTGRL